MPVADEHELEVALSRAKAMGTDYDTLELKTGRGGFPESATTISAFANAHGGTIVYGVSERDFRPVRGLDVRGMQGGCANAARNDVVPPVVADIRTLEYDGAQVVVANIPEADPRHKPVYVRSRGELNGSYIRVGDGDHRLSSYEIDRLKENAAGSPGYDRAIVDSATVSELDANSIARWIERERNNDYEATKSLSDDDLLLTRGVLAPDRDCVHRPTLAGLLCFGTYPQSHFPMLRISYARFPTDLAWSKDTEYLAEEEWSEARYDDKASFEGSIPQMVSRALARLNRAMGHRGVPSGAVMEQVPQFPLLAIREGLANALMHRDYSRTGCATPVRVELRPKSLTIRNPGGLFGSMTVEMLGEAGGVAYRNQTLARILENVTYTEDGHTGPVVEAFGTGFRTILRELSRAYLPRPTVRSSLGEFVLRMVDRDVSTTKGVRSSNPGDRSVRWRSVRADAVAATYDFLMVNGPSSSKEIAAALGVSKQTAVRYLGQLMEEGRVERIGAPKSPRQLYRVLTTYE